MTNTSIIGRIKNGLAGIVLAGAAVLGGCSSDELTPQQEQKVKTVIIYNGTLSELNSRPDANGKYEFVPNVYNYRHNYAFENNLEELLVKNGYDGLVNVTYTQYCAHGTPIRLKQEKRK